MCTKSFRFFFFFVISRLKTSIQICSSLCVFLTGTSVAPHVFSPAWHDTQKTAQSQSTYKGYMIPPLLTLHCPSPILSLPGYNTDCHNRKGNVGAIFKSNSLLHYKKGKGFAMVHSASCMAAWLSGAPMWPWDTEREQGWESLPNPPPSPQWSAEACWGLQSTPAPPPAAAAH